MKNKKTENKYVSKINVKRQQRLKHKIKRKESGEFISVLTQKGSLYKMILEIVRLCAISGLGNGRGAVVGPKPRSFRSRRRNR